MTTLNISDINSILTKYRLRREKALDELKIIDECMKHWVEQREVLRAQIEGTDTPLFDEMFGG